MLFVPRDRQNAAPKTAGETDSAFLERSSRPEIERVRLLINQMLERYPRDHVQDLLTRVQSGDARHFRSSFFELLLHEFLVRLGFTMTPHPELPNGSRRRPDFLVECPDGSALYLEAASASEDNGRDAGAEARKATALDILDAATHPAFVVAIESEGDPTSQPSGNRLTRDVLGWLESLNVDAVIAEWNRLGNDALPEMRWRHEDWDVRVQAIPIRPERREAQRRLIGMRGYGAGVVDTWSPLRDSVVAKSRHYGDLTLPLVIAVNADSFALHPIDEVQALFGQEQYVFSTAQPDAEPRFERAPNGAWRGVGGPRARRASGAWFFPDLTPFTVATRTNRLYLNPWANLPVPPAFLRMPHVIPVGGTLENRGGVEFREALGLPFDWPSST
ncbi:MAG: hypothetical protein ACO1PB_12545 [Ramlibacter sp.]